MAFDRVLKRIQECIRTRRYVMTIHAEEEMNDDDLSIHDVEHAIDNGEILERQRDQETAESKYRIRGEAIHGGKLEMVGKIGPTGRFVIITVYQTEKGLHDL